MFCIPRNNESTNPITAGLFEPFEVEGQNCRSVALQSFCSWMNPRLLSANDVMFSCVLFGKWADTAVLCEIYHKL